MQFFPVCGIIAIIAIIVYTVLLKKFWSKSKGSNIFALTDRRNKTSRFYRLHNNTYGKRFLMITINHVTKSFGNDKTAVNDTTWTVPDGGITGFIGPNGAGKSTTLKMVTGVLKPDSGNILINDADISKDP